MDFWLVLVLLVIGVVPILAIAAFVIALQNRGQIKRIRAELAGGAATATAAARPAPVTPSPAQRSDVRPPTPKEAAPVPPAQTWRAMPPPKTQDEPVTPQPKPAAQPLRAAKAAVAATKTPKSPRAGFEERLTSSWLVWLGGIALALGGAFLVKYSIDQGWFGPVLRVMAGTVLGVALTVAGEWLRRRPMQQAIAAVRPDFVPGALTSAGVSIAFGSIYAAYALYDLIPALVAFAALAMIAVAAIALSLWQGTFVAIIGVLGAYVTPFLVSSGTTNAFAMFPYLLAVTAAAIWITKYRGWWWLNWLALAGSAGWALIWCVGAWDRGDILVVGPYLMAISALFLIVRREPEDAPENTKTNVFTDTAMQVAYAAAAAAAFVMFIAVQLDSFDVAARLSLAGLAALFLWYARVEQRLSLVAPLAAIMVAMTMLVWHQPTYIPAHTQPSTPVTPPELMPFLLTCAAFGLAFLVAGYLTVRDAVKPAVWAIVSAATPIALMIIAYWRVENFETSISWALTAMALALVFMAATRSFIDGTDKNRPVLATYAVATIAALILGATMVLRDGWLTVAFAAMLPAVAWVESRVPEPGLRKVALGIATLVLVRLALNPYVLDYTISGIAPGVNWLLYGYGLPSVLFFAASRMFRARGDDKLVATLEAGALIFLTMLISFELRHLLSPDGRLDHYGYDIAEMAINTAVWGVTGLILLRGHLRQPRFVFKYGWMVYAVMALGQVVAFHLLFMNPYFSGDKLGFTPVVNLLFLLYALPAMIALGYVWLAGRAEWAPVQRFAGGLALVLSFVWLTTEIRHAFHGTRLDTGPVTDAEWWAYSAGWLIYGLALLGLGLWRKSAALRYASLAVILLTVAKVFLFDMAALEGLLRALSFLGLGAALVAIGFFYQHFVFARPESTNPPEEAARKGRD